MPLLASWNPSNAYYKQSIEKINKSVEELTIDLHEAILSIDVEAIERLMAEGADPNLSIKECVKNQDNDAEGETLTFKDRIKNIQRSLVIPWHVKSNAINLALVVRSVDDEHHVTLKSKNQSRRSYLSFLKESDDINEFVHFLIHHEKTILDSNGNKRNHRSSSSISTPAEFAKLLDEEFKKHYPRYPQCNSMTKLQREIASARDKKISKESLQRKQAMSKWESLLDEMKFADVTFECPDGTVSAHKCVLVSNVKYFSAAFSNSWEETTGSVWKTDKPRVVLEALIKYIYTDEIPNHVLRKHATELLSISSVYQMTKLQTICKDWLVSHLSISNVCDVLHYNFKTVKNKCFEFLEKNSTVALGKPHIVQFGVDHPALWKEVNDFVMESSYSSGQKRKRNA